MSSDCKNLLDRVSEIFRTPLNDCELFVKALTHTSYTRENDLSQLESYERLEFFGDAVLKLCVSEMLYKKFPDYNEGQLTKIRSIIVSDNFLAQVAKELGVVELIILGKREEKMGGRKRTSIIACAFESLLGAFYLDGSFKSVYDFLSELFDGKIVEVDSNFAKFNAKAALQEYTQGLNKKLPEYKTVEQIGPEHDKIFVVEVSYMNELLAKGEGRTKREAEQDAAYRACKKLGAVK